MPVALDELAGPDAPEVLARLRTRTPVARVDGLDGWLVTGHALALQVMRDARIFTVDDPRFSTARVVGPSMLSTDGVQHRRHRAPFAPPLRAAGLPDRFGAEVDRLVVALVDRLRPAGAADLRTELAGPLSVAVVAHVLGLSDVDPPTVLRWYTDIVSTVTALSAGRTPDDAGARAVHDLGTAVRGALDAPLLAAARSTLGADEIVSNAAVMMFGGIETTEGMIAILFAHLLADADLLARVTVDPALVPAAVEESLRLEPAAAVVDRYATADVELGGARLRAGDLVRVSLTAANRDPAVFADPDAFRLGRPDVHRQLAFARGPHACVAMDLARLETVAVVRAALAALPGLHRTAPTPIQGLVFRKPPTVPVAWRVPT